ncbi:MAG TPA: sodium:alanine symporter family protein, partial [Candidatus Faecousia faecipullorum]|nr:sodium:alanine symporter family protein [Candidatus Faecousia faecipullorum]
MAKFLMSLNALVWGAPALLLILGVGLFYSLRLSFFQLRFLPRAFRLFFAGQKEDNQGTSPFRALCTALAATVGTGNIVGVAGAICLGGPGAIFWMWVSGVLGMITKYAEVVLSCHFRVRTKTGWAGGPMYVMTRGLGQAFRPMAWLYSLFGLIAAFGVGNAAQVNALVTGVHSVLTLFGKTPDRTGDVILGILLAAAIGTLLLGGAKRIGAAAEMLVPI